MAPSTEKTSSGVQELLERLRAEGLEAGRFQGERALAEARDEARRVVEQAEREAAETRARAAEESARLRRAGEEAIQLAARDAILSMRKRLSDLFENLARESLRDPLRDPDLAKRLALEVAAQALASPEDGERPAATLHVPAVADEALGGFVRAHAEAMLRAGVELKADDSFAGGIRAQLSGGDVRVDLDDQALAAYLLRRMAPQFRSLVDAALKTTNAGGGAA